MRRNFFLMAVALLVINAGPILVDTEVTGHAVVWKDHVVRYNPETGVEGTLGRLSNEEALRILRQFFQDWRALKLGDIPVVDFTVEEGAGLGSVDTTNLDKHFTYCPPTATCKDELSPFVTGSARSGQTPIVFDTDGAITDLIQGVGAKDSIVGFAGPRVTERVDGLLAITEGQAVLNGRFIDCPEGASSDDPCQKPEIDFEEFKGAIFHEVGHLLGLDHSQVNLASAVKSLQGNKAEVDAVPTMFPLLIDGKAQLSPALDDIISIASLYPAPAFTDSFCTIEGKVLQADGVSELQGVNVVARRVDNPLTEATSFVSGQLFVGIPKTCKVMAGGFSIKGLTPAVRYSLEIEKISRAFTGGSSIEPCDPAQSNFQEKKIPGAFFCNVGGQVITVGTDTTTQIVTSSRETSTPASSETGGCSLIPHPLLF